MNRGTMIRVALGFIWLACSTPTGPIGNRVMLPGGSGGIGFDDLRYSVKLRRVLVPAGRTGMLDLVDPDTLAVSTVSGFGTAARYAGGHGDGPTSVDEGQGMLFVTDRTTGLLNVVDPSTRTITASVPLSSAPDYVRYVATTGELWVTEPDADQIEIFAVAASGSGLPQPVGTIHVSDGPESLVVDNRRRRAYSHRWQATTVAIDVTSRAIVEEWQNGCEASRGLALDEERGFLMVACAEGRVTVLDVNARGRVLSTLTRGSGYDVIGYAPDKGHLYLAGSSCRCLVTLGVSATGTLTFLTQRDAGPGTHCVTADDAGHAWWCDQDRGAVWRVDDIAPKSH